MENPNSENDKRYDLEERSFLFAQRVRAFLRKLPRSDANTIDGRQLLRASGSIGANYIEANDSLGKKDFVMHIKISRKESKESRLFLRLLFVGDDPGLLIERSALVQEATELMNIFGAIFRKSDGRGS